jgi:DNA-directed RNA polymerase specialized sigma24 family protein
MGADPHGRFVEIYEHAYRPVLGYVLRRCRDPDDAADVVAETFTTAWRRIEEVPQGDEATLWLYGVARRTLANHRRGERRLDQDLLPRRFRWKRLTGNVARHERQHLAALVVETKGDWSRGEARGVQVRQVCLNRHGEGPDRAADGVPHPHDPLGDAVAELRSQV